MIQRFGDDFTPDIYNGVASARTRRFPAGLLPIARRKLDMLNAATTLQDLASPPGNRLEALKGAYAGYYSVRINQQWRIIFRWTAGGPELVQIIDYH